VTITSSTISGNTISGNSLGKGAGIYNEGTLNIANSTVSSNSIQNGGMGAGIYHDHETGVAEITHSSITNNSISVLGMGGGLWNNGTANVKNTIIAGNSVPALPGNTYPDVIGIITGDNHNLIGDLGDNTGYGTIGTGSDIINPVISLCPLQKNRGGMYTHPLLPNSPAVNAGDDQLANDAGLTTDQRGAPRITATQVDIGAVESISTTTVFYDFSAETFNVLEDDTTHTFNQVILFRTGDLSLTSTVDVVLTGNTATADEDFTADTITLTFKPCEGSQTVPIEILGDTQLESDENFTLSLNHFTPMGLAGSSQPTATVTLINDENHAPDLEHSDEITLSAINEDIANQDNVGNVVSGLIIDRVTDLDKDVVGIAVTSLDSRHGIWQYSSDEGNNWADFPNEVAENQAVLLDETALIRFVPNADYHGTATMIFRAWDKTTGQLGDTNVDTTLHGDATALSRDIATASITIDPINDKPSLIASNRPVITQNTGQQIISKWATLNAGAANESEQSLEIMIIVNNEAFFATRPTVDSEGTLIYSPAENITGTTTFEIKVQDNGGTNKGGMDTSDMQTFSITIVEPLPPACQSYQATSTPTFTLTAATLNTLCKNHSPKRGQSQRRRH